MKLNNSIFLIRVIEISFQVKKNMLLEIIKKIKHRIFLVLFPLLFLNNFFHIWEIFLLINNDFIQILFKPLYN